jgi:hypothetical protein
VPFAAPRLARRPNKGNLRTRRRDRAKVYVAVPPEVSDALELASFGTFAAVGASDIINSVTIAVNQFQSNTLMGAPVIELWDFSGSGALMASYTGAKSTSPANVDTFTFDGPTYAQLATLRVRVYGNQGTAPRGAVQYLNWTSLTVIFIPAAGLSVLARVATGAGTVPAAVAVTATTRPPPPPASTIAWARSSYY